MTAGTAAEVVAVPVGAGIVSPMPVQDDDAALMLRYAQGDMQAFARLYERHKGPLYRYLLRQTRDAASAEDLFQEVWSRVIATRERYQSLAKFSTFLFSIGHNCFIDYCRRSANSPTARAATLDDNVAELHAPAHHAPERLAASSQTAARLRVALDALPAEQREVFVLYEESGLSLEEIGELTGVGMETAKSRLRYAIAKLRERLAEEREPGEAAARVTR